jgi:membrane protease YdiL (CAAX protease family)
VSGATAEPGGRLFRGKPAYVPRTPWPVPAAIVATVAIVGLGMLGTTLAPAILDLDAAPPHPAAGIPAELLWGLAVFQFVAIALTLAAASLLGGRPREVLALGHAGGWRIYAGAILAMAGLQVVLASVQHALLSHDILTDLRPFVGLVTGPDWPLAAAVLGIGAPLSEELLFRGFLLSALARSPLGFWGAAAISTLGWTTLHWGYSLPGLAEVFAIGMLLSWLLWRTGSLRVTIVCHAVYNSAIVLALRLVDLPAQT